MRLAQFLASAGVAARRKCESLIEEGKVSVNNQEVTDLSFEVNDGDTVKLDGKKVSISKKRYVMLYKPVGYTCSSEDKFAERLALDLLPQQMGRMFTVGRLDRDSEGLLLCTNDGQWTNLLAHPRYGVTKLYRVSVAGSFNSEVLERMRKGVVNEGEFLRPLKVVATRSGRNFAQLEILLNEGKKREIRRMCYSCGLEVKRLLRLRIGALKLIGLKPGEWRDLTAKEVEALREQAMAPPPPKPERKVAEKEEPREERTRTKIINFYGGGRYQGEKRLGNNSKGVDTDFRRSSSRRDEGEERGNSRGGRSFYSGKSETSSSRGRSTASSSRPSSRRGESSGGRGTSSRSRPTNGKRR